MTKDIDSLLFKYIFQVIYKFEYNKDCYNLCRGIAETFFLAKSLQIYLRTKVYNESKNSFTKSEFINYKEIKNLV